MDISNKNHENSRHKRQQQSKILIALFVVAFGVLYLLEESGMNIPDWIVSWETILIAAGIVHLYKCQFQCFTGYAMVGIGVAFIVDDLYPNSFDSDLIVPILVISFGLLMLLKSLGIFRKGKSQTETYFDEDVDMTSEDFITSSALFGGVNKTVLSKNFQGGEFKTVFGGTEINLSQADIQKPVVINSTTAFGGLTLIVPSTWQVNSDIVAIFGGIEDNRPRTTEVNRDPNKVITLKGNCVFGGVEIQSYI